MPTIVVLGQPPKTFHRDVTFTALDGAELTIPCDFVYRTREDFGALLDATFAEPEGESIFAGDGFGAERQQALVCKTNGKYLSNILSAWGLDMPFTEPACVQLARELPAGAQAVMDAYRLAITEGRLGN